MGGAGSGMRAVVARVVRQVRTPCGRYGGEVAEIAPDEWAIEAYGPDEQRGGTFTGSQAGAVEQIRRWWREMGWHG